MLGLAFCLIVFTICKTFPLKANKITQAKDFRKER